MILKVNNKIVMIGGYIPVILSDGEIILKFRTRGTCFPARSDGYTPRSSYFQILSYPEVDNKVYIDYSDGTGWHIYTFKQNNQNRGISFRCQSTTDPTQIALNTGVYGISPNDGYGGGEFGLHFYQDLQDPDKINTVDHDYSQERDIFMKFEKPTQLLSIIFYNTVLLNVFPSLAKLTNLEEQLLSLIPDITSFENQAVNTNLKRISMADLGITSNVLPLWVKNSVCENLNLDAYYVGETTNGFDSEIVTPLKTTLEYLSLSGVAVNYPMPESFSELLKLQSLTMGRDFPAENFTFPSDLTPLTAFKILNLSEKISFPLAQVKRFIQEVPSVGKNINLRTFGATLSSKDFILDDDDYSVEILVVSYGRWNNGVPPTCVQQMKNLKALSIYGSYNYTVANGAYNLTGWGDFSGATAIEEIYFNWQQKMDLTFPAWLTALSNLKTFSCTASFETLQAMDNFVDSVYNFVLANASMVAGNTAFRQMNIVTFDSSRSANSFRPSGTYQEPVGYIQGSNNGTPATPMEKIYVLTFQFEHLWILKP